MPSVSKKQQRFMMAEMDRKRKGKRTKTNMSLDDLEEFAYTLKTKKSKT